MFLNTIYTVGEALSNIARRSAYIAGGTIFLVVGIAFLTTGGWMVLSDVRDPAFASLVCGAVYAGLGLIIVGIANRRYRLRDPSTGLTTGTVARQRDGGGDTITLATAFLIALNSGLERQHSKRAS